MKPEVGKVYTTRNGGTVRIKYNSNDLGFAYSERPFAGTVLDPEFKRSAFFTVEGKYLTDRDHDFDLIEELCEQPKK